MIEGNDQSLEYVGYQVPRSDLESNNNSEDPDARAQTQGSLLFYLKKIMVEYLKELLMIIS